MNVGGESLQDWQSERADGCSSRDAGPCTGSAVWGRRWLGSSPEETLGPVEDNYVVGDDGIGDFDNWSHPHQAYIVGLNSNDPGVKLLHQTVRGPEALDCTVL